MQEIKNKLIPQYTITPKGQIIEIRKIPYDEADDEDEPRITTSTSTAIRIPMSELFNLNNL